MARQTRSIAWWHSTGCILLGGAFVATFAVWFVGFDVLWAVAAVLAAGSVGALRVNFTMNDAATWDRPTGDAPRGVRLVVVQLEGALDACDRLARPHILRWMGAMLHGERDDHRSRAVIVRRMRALLLAELHDRAPDVVDASAAATALFGTDAHSILSPSDGPLVTTAAIARCLDAVDRLNTETKK